MLRSKGHGAPTGNRSNINSPARRSNNKNEIFGGGKASMLFLLVSSALSFYLGTFLVLNSSMRNCNNSSELDAKDSQQNLISYRRQIAEYKTKIKTLEKGGATKEDDDDAGAKEVDRKLSFKDYEKKISKLEKEKLRLKDEITNIELNNLDADTAKKGEGLFPNSVSKFANGLARVDKLDFFEKFDIGVPMDDPTPKDKDVIILYNSPKSLPKTIPKSYSGPTKFISNIDDAFQNCDFVNVLLTSHHATNQCTAIVPQYEAYHTYRFGRTTREQNKPIDRSLDFTLVGRGYQGGNGKNQFVPPGKVQIQQNWDHVKNYLTVLDEVLGVLKPITKKIAQIEGKRKTIIVMVVNFGQSELILNFICSAKARGFGDLLKHILVFTTDIETKDLVESFGLNAFYDEKIFGLVPAGEAEHYGDKNFVAMMMTKVTSVHLVNELGYDVLFQDADIIWHRDPLQWFTKELEVFNDFDIIFQDDGGHTARFSPLSANTGFYYMKYNDKTQYLLSALLLSGDQIMKWDSHQSALIVKMNEHISLFGLRVKVINRNNEELPSGYHYHQKTGAYMRSLLKGEVHPVIFHMCWTKNKDNKILFFRQMGDWYLQSQCIHQSVNEIVSSHSNYNKNSLSTDCCAVEPLISCHYRDKPSIQDCSGSPPIDEGNPSFWPL